MKSLRSSVLLAALVTCSVVGCAPKQAIDASAIEVPLRSVTNRHDRYVLADPTLSEPERSTALRSSALLIQIEDEALGNKGAPGK